MYLNSLHLRPELWNCEHELFALIMKKMSNA